MLQLRGRTLRSVSAAEVKSPACRLTRGLELQSAGNLPAAPALPLVSQSCCDEQRPATGDRRSQRHVAQHAQEHAAGHGHCLARSRVLAVRVLRRRRRPDASPTSASSALDSNPEKGLKLVEQVREIAPECSHAGRQQLDRRPGDPAGHAGRRQGVPDPAGQGRRPGRRPRPHQRERSSARGDGREPGLPRDRRLRRDRRRRHDQPGRQPGLRPGRRPAEQRGAGRSRPVRWAMPTCSSTRFPTTRWSMSRRTSRGSTSRCSSGRSPSTPRACTCCRGRCSCKTPR